MSRHNYSCALASSCHRPDQYHPREDGGKGYSRKEGGVRKGVCVCVCVRERERERERERGHDVYKITIYMDIYYSFYSAVLHK